MNLNMTQIFHYTPPDEDYPIPEFILSLDLLAGEMIEALKTFPSPLIDCTMVAITDELLEAVNREERDQKRIRELMSDKALHDRACFLLHFSHDDSHLLADGNHRVLARHRLGLENFRAALIKEEVWHKAVIMAVPKNAEQTKWALDVSVRQGAEAEEHG